MYPKFDYSYPACGRNQRGRESIFNEYPSGEKGQFGALSLSYFVQPNSSNAMKVQFNTEKQKNSVMKSIQEKRA